MIEKPNLDLILRPPKAILRKVVFNPNARVAQFYNMVDDLAQGLGLEFTSTKAWIFPWRFSTFLTFWCKIGSNRNEASLYPRLAVIVSIQGVLFVVVSTAKELDVAVSMAIRRYSDGTVNST